MIPWKDHTSRYKIEYAGFVAWERIPGLVTSNCTARCFYVVF